MSAIGLLGWLQVKYQVSDAVMVDISDGKILDIRNQVSDIPTRNLISDIN